MCVFIEFTAEFVENAKLVVQALGLLSIIVVFIQLIQNNRWKRIEFSINKDWEAKIELSFREYKNAFSRKEILYINSSNWNDRIVYLNSNPRKYIALIKYLNEYENIAALLSRGAIDKKYAYICMSNNLIDVFEMYEPFINYIRKDGDPYSYMGIELLYEKWKKKQIQEHKKKSKEIPKIDKKIEKIKKEGLRICSA